MDLPAYLLLFWLLYAVVVLPSALVNRVALVLVVVRGLAQATYNAGLPESETLMALYAGGLFFALHWSRTVPCFVAAALFLPLFAASIYRVADGISAADEYWIRYGLAVAQVLFVPFGNDWQKARRFAAAARQDWRLSRSLRMARA